ncbi:MAG: hypothetical protein RBS32_06055, partial [Aliarcobacter sp.]|nr:hypothetical protein [Aliarcobacter sp.]
MISFEELAKKEYLLNDNEIFSFNYKDEKYWLKKARETAPNKIQKFFYKFLPFELLIPPLVKNKKEALKFETSKIEKFEELGINVPKISYKCENFFVLEDSGISVNTLLRDKNISKEKFYFYVDKLLVELSKIHN